MGNLDKMSSHLFFLPPRIASYLRSMKGYNIIFLRSQEVARHVFLFAKNDPSNFMMYSAAALVSLYAINRIKQKNNSNLKEEIMFAHPANRNLKDQWGYRLIETPPFFRCFF